MGQSWTAQLLQMAFRARPPYVRPHWARYRSLGWLMSVWSWQIGRALDLLTQVPGVICIVPSGSDVLAGDAKGGESSRSA